LVLLRQLPHRRQHFGFGLRSRQREWLAPPNPRGDGGVDEGIE
jgi:hypothetical protein